MRLLTWSATSYGPKWMGFETLVAMIPYLQIWTGGKQDLERIDRKIIAQLSDPYNDRLGSEWGNSSSGRVRGLNKVESKRRKSSHSRVEASDPRLRVSAAPPL